MTPSDDSPGKGAVRGEGRAAPVDDAASRSPWRRVSVAVLQRLGLVLIPLALIGLLETGLRIGGFGYDPRFYVPVDGGRAFIANDRFGWRFFPRSVARTPAATRLASPKPEGAFRIFVLGGSAAMGTPDPAFGFGRMLEVMLEESYPGRDFEVVNAAMTAINSHVVVTIAGECAKREPDLFVVYLGNNEVVGPYGPGTIFAGFSPSRALIRAGIAIRATRIGQLAQSVAGRLAGGGSRAPGEWRGMEMFLERRVAADDSRLDRVYHHFRENLREICRIAGDAGAGVILSTVVTNLRDSAPFASLHAPTLTAGDRAAWEREVAAASALQEAGRHDEAVAAYENAGALDDAHAELHFRLGHSLLALGRTIGAREHLVQARDLDALRFRADSRINDIIRDVAADGDARAVSLVDAERELSAVAPGEDGIPGDRFLYEHVHFRFEGNHALASAVLRAVAERLGRPASGAPVPLETIAARLAFSEWNRWKMAEMITGTMSRPPFTAQLDHRERLAARVAELAALEASADNPEAREEAIAICRRALERRPRDLFIHGKLGDLLLEQERLAEAMREWEFLLEEQPDKVDVLERVGTTLARAGRLDQAIATFEEVVRRDRYQAEWQYRLGYLLERRQRDPDAIARYRRALLIDPTHVAAAEALRRLGVDPPGADGRD